MFVNFDKNLSNSDKTDFPGRLVVQTHLYKVLILFRNSMCTHVLKFICCCRRESVPRLQCRIYICTEIRLTYIFFKQETFRTWMYNLITTQILPVFFRIGDKMFYVLFYIYLPRISFYFVVEILCLHLRGTASLTSALKS